MMAVTFVVTTPATTRTGDRSRPRLATAPDGFGLATPARAARAIVPALAFALALVTCLRAAAPTRGALPGALAGTAIGWVGGRIGGNLRLRQQETGGAEQQQADAEPT